MRKVVKLNSLTLQNFASLFQPLIAMKIEQPLLNSASSSSLIFSARLRGNKIRKAVLVLFIYFVIPFQVFLRYLFLKITHPPQLYELV